MATKQKDEEKTETLAQALVSLHTVRDSVAKFLAQNCDAFSDIATLCDRNCWEPGVAYELRAAMATLGGVLATLVLWDKEVLPADPKPVLARVGALEHMASEPQDDKTAMLPSKVRIGAVLEQAMYDYVYENFGSSEAESPSWNIESLATHLADVMHDEITGKAYKQKHEIKYND